MHAPGGADGRRVLLGLGNDSRTEDKMSDDARDWLEYFSGGVPTGEYFRMTLADLREIGGMEDPNGDWSGISRVLQLCFIGLMSYFEAFCKDHFASLLNIEPTLVADLRARGQDVSVDANHVVLFGDDIGARIGFVLAEKYDFGAAKKINALFRALLKITPFSRDEARKYDQLLHDRNLLVHHGGTYTLKYLEQSRAIPEALRTSAFFNSRRLPRSEVLSAIDFIEGIARKLLVASHGALTEYGQKSGSQYSTARQKALAALLWWGDEAST